VEEEYAESGRMVRFRCRASSGGCGGTEPAASAVSNGVTPPAASKVAPSVEAADTSFVVSGPIIVEHQVEITAQRDGFLAKFF